MISRRALMSRWVAQRSREAHGLVMVFWLRLSGMMSLGRWRSVVLEEPTIMVVGHVASIEPRHKTVSVGADGD